MNNQSFAQEYVLLSENYGFRLPSSSAFKINLVQKRNGSESQNIPDCNSSNQKISVHFPNNIDKGAFDKLRRFKYISIIQPEGYFEYEKNEHILIYQDYLKYRLTKEDMQKEEIKKKIYLQIALLYAELEKRGYPWPLEQLEQLYYLDGLLYVSLADYNFSFPNNLTYLEQFINFSKKHFFDLLGVLQSSNNLIDFNSVVNELCKNNKIEKYNFKNDNQTETYYENVLKYLLQVEKFDRLNDLRSNSDVKKFKTPLGLLKLHPELKQQNSNEEQVCIYKSTIILTDAEKKRLILSRIDREIDLMEKNTSIYVAACSVYFRIFETPYLIIKKYEQTLEDILKNWKPTEESLKKDVYAFSYKFARGIKIINLALNDFHLQEFQHRDLKPNNIFFNKKDFQDSDVFIGDLDRSKSNYENKAAVDQTAQNQDNVLEYNPPEEYVNEEKQYSYDVFQYGIIILQVANKGQYIGINLGPRIMDTNEFNQFYCLAIIFQKLKEFNYDEEFIQLVGECLKKKPQDRLHTQTILEITEKLYQKVTGQAKANQKQVLESKQINGEMQEIHQQQQINKDQNESIQQAEGQLQAQQSISDNQDKNLADKIKILQQIIINHFEKENQNK